MAIQLPFRLRRLAEPEFRRLDYQVMGHAFAAHRELGRLCEEDVYRNDLAARLRAAGYQAETEAMLRVTFRDFTKVYFLDLVVNDSIVYELKAAESVTRDHEAQLLNYLLLCDAPAGRLVNFRPPSVVHRTLNAPVSQEEQRRVEYDFSSWRPESDRDTLLVDLVRELIAEWGSFLELGLYQEALIHLLAGEQGVLSDVPLSREGIALGTHPLHLFSDDTAIRLTALPRDTSGTGSHLIRLLRLTPLRRFHWINLNRHTVEFRTLFR
jgi:GxxExxY protein